MKGCTSSLVAMEVLLMAADVTRRIDTPARRRHSDYGRRQRAADTVTTVENDCRCGGRALPKVDSRTNEDVGEGSSGGLVVEV